MILYQTCAGMDKWHAEWLVKQWFRDALQESVRDAKRKFAMSLCQDCNSYPCACGSNNYPEPRKMSKTEEERKTDYTTMPISLEEARLVHNFLDEHNASQSSSEMWTFMNYLRAYLRRKTHDNMLLESSEKLSFT